MIRICEVGPRDGLQNIKRIIPTKGKIRLIDLLSQTGLRHIETTSFVNNDQVPQFHDAQEVARGITREPGITYSALAPNTYYLKRALDAGINHVAILVSADEDHSRDNLRKSIPESLETARVVTDVALARGAKVRAYLSAVFGYGTARNVTFENVSRLIKVLCDMGVHEISLGDTTGLGNPETVKGLLSKLKTDRSAPFDKLVMHFHDAGLGMENVDAAYKMGITGFDGSIGGIGGCPFARGATGNVATEDLVFFFDFLGIPTGVTLSKLKEPLNFLHKDLELETHLTQT